MHLKVRQPARGFTLIELMIVVSLIGIISSLAIPGYLKFTARSSRTEMLNTVSKMKLYLKNIYDNQGTFATDQTLGAGVQSAINPTAPVPIGQPAQWDQHATGWSDLPFPPEGGLRMRYAYTPNADRVTFDVCGSFPGMGPNVVHCTGSLMGNYRYVEIFYGNGTSDVTEVPGEL